MCGRFVTGRIDRTSNKAGAAAKASNRKLPEVVTDFEPRVAHEPTELYSELQESLSQQCFAQWSTSTATAANNASSKQQSAGNNKQQSDTHKTTAIAEGWASDAAPKRSLTMEATFKVA